MWCGRKGRSGLALCAQWGFWNSYWEKKWEAKISCLELMALVGKFWGTQVLNSMLTFLLGCSSCNNSLGSQAPSTGKCTYGCYQRVFSPFWGFSFGARVKWTCCLNCCSEFCQNVVFSFPFCVCDSCAMLLSTLIYYLYGHAYSMKWTLLCHLQWCLKLYGQKKLALKTNSLLKADMRSSK